MNLLVVSPHLDDAVLGAGTFLAAHRPPVLTLFAGDPPAGLTPYDEACGFASSPEAMATRRLEDAEALTALGCEWTLLDHLDGQYQRPAPVRVGLAGDVSRVARATGVDGILGPLGIQHPDHLRAAEAVLLLAERGTPTWLYEELPYRVAWPELALRRLEAVRDAWDTVPDDIGDAGRRPDKERALACYRSQDLDAHSCLVPERYWRLVPR